MLVVTRRTGEGIIVSVNGIDVGITVRRDGAARTKLIVDAPKSVKITRIDRKPRRSEICQKTISAITRA